LSNSPVRTMPAHFPRPSPWRILLLVRNGGGRWSKMEPHTHAIVTVLVALFNLLAG
jgi:hypothetical protein